jgi:endonuclease-3
MKTIFFLSQWPASRMSGFFSFPRCLLLRHHYNDQYMHKQTFHIDVAFKRISKAVEPFKKAALFELAERGFNSPFEQLVACIISIRTYDEVTVPTALRFFEQARTPSETIRLNQSKIDDLIRTCTFHERKAGQILEIARQIVNEYDGGLPCESKILQAFPGVGPKCANLVLGIACNQPFISVDIHVHRVTNRWGYVHASTPEKTMTALAEMLPRKYWIDINRLLVPFGKHICTGKLPRCSTCPVLEMCHQVGVTSHR